MAEPAAPRFTIAVAVRGHGVGSRLMAAIETLEGYPPGYRQYYLRKVRPTGTISA